MENEIITGVSDFTLDMDVLNNINNNFNFRDFISYILDKTEIKIIKELDVRYKFIYKNVMLLNVHVTTNSSSNSFKRGNSLKYYMDFCNLKTYNKDIDDFSDKFVKYCLSYLNMNKMYFNIKKLVIFNDIKTNSDNILGVETTSEDKSSLYYREASELHKPCIIHLPYYCNLFKYKYKNNITRFKIVLNNDKNLEYNDSFFINYLGIGSFLLRYSILLFKDEADKLKFIDTYNDNIEIKYHPNNVKINFKNVLNFLSRVYAISVTDKDIFMYDFIKQDMMLIMYE